MPEAATNLIEGLLRPSAYAHPVGPIRLIETHISWVILTGSYAYKIKKPIDLGFVDFSTLDRRHFFCDEELRLNRRLAPELYLSVVPITGSPKSPCIEGPGPAIDYAVKMYQFDEESLFDNLFHLGRIEDRHIDRLAELLAAFHAQAPRAEPTGEWGRPEGIRRMIEANFEHLLPLAETAEERGRLEDLRDWSDREYLRRTPSLDSRRQRGFVRECHGDLHLGNLVLIGDRPIPFDCIEFNPELRWIDVISEVAFLAMDLDARGNRALAYRFVNHYEELCGDYEGLRLWDFYRMYRALVRAKVIRLMLAHTKDSSTTTRLLERYGDYLAFATGLANPPGPMLIIMHGLSGSGKSHVAAKLAERLPAIRIRSDVERRRLARMAPGTATDATLGAELYGEDATRLTYGQLRDLSETLLRAGLSVIVDATFLRRWQREQFRELARATGARLCIADVVASPAVLRQRVARRLIERADPSEATTDVLDWQLRTAEPFMDLELADVTPVDGEQPDIDRLLSIIRGG